ncbi:MAG: hypothetical protein AB9903_09810 [Vulcanimicrobiota bacterium]
MNDYSWGDFKGDKDEWVEKYFDAFLYFANWGTRVLKLRLPSRLLDLTMAEYYCSGESVSVREKSGRTIISFVSEDEDRYEDEWVEDSCLSSLISVRSDLARGDLRALYLGWILCAQNGEFDDGDVEPPVPPGLGQLSVSLNSLVEFLRIDTDLLHVAAEKSEHNVDGGPKPEELRSWLARQPAAEKDDMLASLITGEDPTLAAELLRRFLEQRDGGGGEKAGEATRRTVDELLEAAEVYAEKRQRIAAEKRAEEKRRRDSEAAAARARSLDGIAGKEEKLWTDIDSLITTKQPRSYDQAIRLLKDLHDLVERSKSGQAFNARLEALRAAHMRKPSLIERIRNAGL